MTNLITGMVSIETVWRPYACGECYFLWRFYGRIGLQIVKSFHGENMANLISRQSSY